MTHPVRRRSRRCGRPGCRRADVAMLAAPDCRRRTRHHRSGFSPTPRRLARSEISQNTVGAPRASAQLLRTLVAADPPWPLIDADKAIPLVEKRTKLALAESQKGAIRVALRSQMLVITGGPGVGKTTLVNS